MAKAVRWAGYGLLVLIGLALIAAAWIWIASANALGKAENVLPERLVAPTAAQVADAPRMMTVLGCRNCHGDGLQGRVFLSDPKIGTIHAPNLTAIAAAATDQQLAQGIRQGIGHDGRKMVVMPSEAYQFMTDQEVAALVAGIRAFPRGGRPSPPIALGPLARFGLATGRFKPVPEMASAYRASRLADLGPDFAAGRHLAEIACSSCHGPDLKGKQVEPGVVSTDLALAGAYDLAQFTTLMRQGKAPSGRDLGLMASVARKDFSAMTDGEVAALHAYLVERAKRQP